METTSFNVRKEVEHIRHGFVLAFYFLLRHIDEPHTLDGVNFYMQALKLTCQQGGDADTNACIAGGMIGALVGIKAIPKSMVRKVLKYDCTRSEELGG